MYEVDGKWRIQRVGGVEIQPAGVLGGVMRLTALSSQAECTSSCGGDSVYSKLMLEKQA